MFHVKDYRAWRSRVGRTLREMLIEPKTFGPEVVQKNKMCFFMANGHSLVFQKQGFPGI
jgi:hypothetical protein